MPYTSFTAVCHASFTTVYICTLLTAVCVTLVGAIEAVSVAVTHTDMGHTFVLQETVMVPGVGTTATCKYNTTDVCQ